MLLCYYFIAVCGDGKRSVLVRYAHTKTQFITCSFLCCFDRSRQVRVFFADDNDATNRSVKIRRSRGPRKNYMEDSEDKPIQESEYFKPVLLFYLHLICHPFVKLGFHHRSLGAIIINWNQLFSMEYQLAGMVRNNLASVLFCDELHRSSNHEFALWKELNQVYNKSSVPRKFLVTFALKASDLDFWCYVRFLTNKDRFIQLFV